MLFPLLIISAFNIFLVNFLMKYNTELIKIKNKVRQTMIYDLTMNGYGLFVWSAHIFSFVFSRFVCVTKVQFIKKK